MRHLLAAFLLTTACGSKPPAQAPSNAVAPTAEAKPACSPTPGDAYDAQTWIAKLCDPRENERAVTQLEQLGDPKAIVPLGELWLAQGRPARVLQVLIGLARPLTPAEATATFMTDYETTGRPASWDKALLFLKRALAEVDVANPRSVDSAFKAAAALGEAKLGLDTLVAFASRPTTKHLIAAQVGAIRAIGGFAGERDKAAAALVQLLGRDVPAHPWTATDKAQRRSLEERFGIHLAVMGATINALGQLRVDSSALPLVVAMYRTPELFMQTRRALVALGPAAKAELQQVLRGKSDVVNALFKASKLDRYCGDHGDQPCQPLSTMDFYAAAVLGDFYDPATVPELLAALERPPLPVYFSDDAPSPNTQHNAVFDALRKIGAPEAAAPLRALWTNPRTDLLTRALAISVYAFVARDEAGVAELGKIAADNTADDTLRMEAASAYARLSRNTKDVPLFQALAAKYLDAAAKKAKLAAAEQPTVKAADRELETARVALDAMKAKLRAVTLDDTKTTDEIQAVTAATRGAEDAFKAVKHKHRDRTAAFKMHDQARKSYVGYARMFQTHVARIEIAARCKADAACYADSLKATPNDVAARNKKLIKDLAAWTPEEKRELADAALDRAMLELGKLGPTASQYTDALLDAAITDAALPRQAILLALPKIAALPCSSCDAKLERAFKAGEGKPALANANLETTVLRSYFSWAK
ncbi:MAG TPA: HEAT repeat domain-containing protein [Kofleriaceae bacterium]|nr:HEAT repeat domain-containing protein [Kofleriaceae bacterium]